MIDYEANFRRRCAEVNQAIAELDRAERILLFRASGHSWPMLMWLRFRLWVGRRDILYWKLYVWGAKRLLGWREI